MFYKDIEIDITKCNYVDGVTIIPLDDSFIYLSEDEATNEELVVIHTIKEDVEKRTPIVNINNLKVEKVNNSKYMLEEHIVNNPYLFSDGKYYSVTKEKQNLLANAIMIYQIKIQTGDTSAQLKWNAIGEECTIWKLEILSTLAIGIAKYVEPLISKQQAYEVQINSCNTVEEIEKLVLDYKS